MKTPVPRTKPTIKPCTDSHIFDLDDDARCDICAIPKSEVVDMERYKREWDERLAND